MFACWCSEMIYYTCNMKRARWLNVVSICKKRRRYCGAVTWKICFFTSAWIEFCSKISLWLCRRFSRIGIFFRHWHYASRIIWKYKQGDGDCEKSGRRAFTKIGSNSRTSRHEHLKHTTRRNWCVFAQNEFDVWGIFFAF